MTPSRVTSRKYIKRFELGRHGSAGWYVQFYGTRPKFAKFFSDLKYGGRINALYEATAFRDKHIGTVPRVVRAGVRVRDKRSKTNVIGVSYTNYKRKYGFYEGYRAVWGPAGAQGTRTFSIQKFGRREAYRLACQARCAGVRSLLDG